MNRLLSIKSSYIFDLQLQNIGYRSQIETYIFFIIPTKVSSDLEIMIKNNKLNVAQGNSKPWESEIIQNIAPKCRKQGLTIKPVWSIEEIHTNAGFHLYSKVY